MAVGVALKFWRLVDRARIDRGWSKDQLSRETAEYTPDGKMIAVSTIDNLRTSSRAPHPRVVHALADALGIDREEAQRAAGLIADPEFEASSSGFVELRRQLMATDLTPQAKAMIAAMMDLAKQHYAAMRPIFEQPSAIDDDRQVG